MIDKPPKIQTKQYQQRADESNAEDKVGFLTTQTINGSQILAFVGLGADDVDYPSQGRRNEVANQYGCCHAHDERQK